MLGSLTPDRWERPVTHNIDNDRGTIDRRMSKCVKRMSRCGPIGLRLAGSERACSKVLGAQTLFPVGEELAAGERVVAYGSAGRLKGQGHGATATWREEIIQKFLL